MMHLCLTEMTVDDVRRALLAAKADGIRNILALRGDPAPGKDKWEPCDGGMEHAVDLVRFIKKEFGDYFCVGVAGYPEGHVDTESFEADIAHLAEKVEAGAEFVLTQFFYDTSVFPRFVDAARKAGISVPIVPGIMPIQSYSNFDKMTRYFGMKVPPELSSALIPIKSDDEAVKEYGIRLGMQMAEELVAAGAVGLHFYTMNLETVVKGIVTGCGLCDASKRRYPWRQFSDEGRELESVRPIYWANRPRSYLSRTATWDEYPNGRWGDARSPAFGDITESHFYAVAVGHVEERRVAWGEAPMTHDDVYGVFVKYIKGEIPRIPWGSSSLASESDTIHEELVMLNTNGFLTINSQPRVNGVRSDDPTFGWGGPGGYVYQKAYVECFVPPTHLRALMEAVKDFPSVSYNATDVRGNTYSNAGKGAQAVTWGAFPCREIVQPTIVDADSFMVWKDEAFALWLQQWACIYDDDSPSYDLICDIHDTYFLVNVIDSDFTKGDIFEVFRRAIESMHPAGEAPITSALPGPASSMISSASAPPLPPAKIGTSVAAAGGAGGAGGLGVAGSGQRRSKV